MKKILGASLVLTGALLSGGCATKKYVQQTAAPIQTKVDQVADQSNKQGTEIDTAKKDIERHETGINAAKERAMSAENRANEAMTAANKADQDAMQAQNASNQNTQAISSLRDNVNTALGTWMTTNSEAETVVPFGFNHDELTSEAKEQLDQFVGQHSSAKRYFITIEGYTDKTGTRSYNDALSRRRAEHVMAYLVTQHSIPVFRIQDIGLANEKPADTGRNRASRAKNRRVEVRMFSADTNLAMAQPGTSQSAQAK